MKRLAPAPLLLLLLLAALAAGLPGAARAQEERPEPAGRVHLTAEAERAVANDRAVVALELTDEDEDPAELADRVSRRVDAALARARQEPGVEVRTGAIRTHPVFHEGELRRWRAVQRVVLETARLDALPALLGALQTQVPIASVEFTVSDEARRETEEALIGEALGRFRARADRVAESLGARGVRIDELFVDTGRMGPPPEPFHAERAVAMQAQAAPPPLAPGTSRVTVTVRGSVQLDLP